MAESSFLQPSIPKFDGHYDHWSMLMENLLRSKEYWSIIEDGIVVAPANSTAEQSKAADDSKLKDLKAKNYLFQAIDRTILETILNKETARDIWTSMRQKFQGSTKQSSFLARMVYLKRKILLQIKSLMELDVVLDVVPDVVLDVVHEIFLVTINFMHRSRRRHASSKMVHPYRRVVIRVSKAVWLLP
ncbi:hypothetical protein GmHk_09G026432 [Glycine max]|nr:hypothetical protein GmHk_09G026432 [Glycine max]